MDENSKKLMSVVLAKHLQYILELPNPKVCDVGGLYSKPKHSYITIFEHIPNLEWVVCDLQEHPSVTHVMPGPYTLPFPDNHFDLVVSGQMLEHCGNPFKSVAEMMRVLKPGGRVVIIVPYEGPFHCAPDGWRFKEYAFKFIADDLGGIKTITDWIDKSGVADHNGDVWANHLFVGEKI